MSKVNIEMSAVELKEEGAKYDLEFPIGTTKKSMVEAINQKINGEEPVKAAPLDVGAKVAGDKKDEGRVTVVIHKSGDPSEVDPVFLGLNGKGITIPRGVECRVKKGYVSILENAKKVTYHFNKKTGETEPRESHSYPFSVIKQTAMSSTYLELCRQVRQEAAISGEGPSSVTGQKGQLAVVVKWVKQAWIDVQKERPDWNFLWAQLSFDTVAATDEYSPQYLGVAPKRIEDSVRIYNKIAGSDDSSFLERVEWVDFKEDYLVGKQESGRPRYFTTKPNGSVQFYPSPDDIYVIEMDIYRAPQVLVDGTDIPLIPYEFEDAIVQRALVLWGAYTDAPEVYRSAKAIYETLITQMNESQLPELRLGTATLSAGRRNKFQRRQGCLEYSIFVTYFLSSRAIKIIRLPRPNGRLCPRSNTLKAQLGHII